MVSHACSEASIPAPDASIDPRRNTRATAGGAVADSMAARGSGPVAVGEASSAGRASAQSICEAVEQLIETREADEAIAEWMQGGG
jgi:hypothetical protein